MIRTTNVKNGFVDLSSVRYVSESTYRLWTRRQTPCRGDVILTREAPLGQVGLIRDDAGIFLGQRIMSYRAQAGILDNRFLLYTLLGSDLQAQIQAIGSGSTVAHMRVPDAHKLTIPTPPLKTQQRIASILSAYDDLIEVNRRRVAILEETARRLFEEWFVHLRFPGHATTPLHDTPDGPVPEGWHHGCASDLLTFDPQTSAADATSLFVPMAALTTNSSSIAFFEERAGRNGSRFLAGDTLLARITPCLENGKTALVRALDGDSKVGVGSTEFIVMRPDRAGRAFTYCLARNPEFRDHARASMSGATGRQRVRVEHLRGYALLLPPAELLASFEEVATPMLDQAEVLARANARLAAARDLLLPRLLSGQLPVAQDYAPALLAAE